MIHHAHVRHHLPGRLRLKVPAAKGDPAWFQHLQRTLLGLPGLTQVEINPITGSVLLHYDAERHAEFLHQLPPVHARHAIVAHQQIRFKGQNLAFCSRISGHGDLIIELDIGDERLSDRIILEEELRLSERKVRELSGRR